MDPFTALIVASLVTWGTVGSGIKDTAAIAKGQTPPSHAYRMAKLAQRGQPAGQQPLGQGPQTAGAPTRYRRITLKDLLTHWWEDGLEVADAWRQRRHETRDVRKAKRRAFLDKKKALVKKGYALLKKRGQDRFGTETEGGAEGGAGAAATGAAGDNVVPLHPRTSNTDNTEEIPMQLQLGDKNTYAGHQDGLVKYQSYFTQVADRIEQIAARAHEQDMSAQTVAKGNTAMQACGQVAAQARAAAQSLAQAHQSVAEQRQATGNRADADYLTTS